VCVHERKNRSDIRRRTHGATGSFVGEQTMCSVRPAGQTLARSTPGEVLPRRNYDRRPSACRRPCIGPVRWSTPPHTLLGRRTVSAESSHRRDSRWSGFLVNFAATQGIVPQLFSSHQRCGAQLAIVLPPRINFPPPPPNQLGERRCGARRALRSPPQQAVRGASVCASYSAPGCSYQTAGAAGLSTRSAGREGL